MIELQIKKDMIEDPFLKCKNGHKFCNKCKKIGWHEKKECNDVII